MKKLYLHVGCGKTGSSALQVWLHNQTSSFAKLGIFYPTYTTAKLPVYQITSGNGWTCFQLLKGKKIDELKIRLQTDFESGFSAVIYSSEAFQNFDQTDLITLKQLSLEIGFEIVVIAFVRDIHDFLYSDYVQNVKRNSLYCSWHAYATEVGTLQHFNVVSLYAQHFENIKVLHYDYTNGSRVDRALLTCLNIEPSAIPEMESRKVNRTLTISETYALVHLNNTMNSLGVPNKEQISRQISDYLIYENPEKEVFFPFQEEVVQHLQNRFGEAVKDFNSKFEVNLEICPAGKEGGRYKHDGDPASEIADFSKVYSLAFRIILNRPEAFSELDYLVNRDRYLVDQLRQKAIEAETTNLDLSYHLMKAALQLRPDGPVIQKKMKEYEAKRKT